MEILFCFLLEQITRIYKEKEHAEVEFTVGYLPYHLIGKATDSFSYYMWLRNLTICILI
jgi:hypothetical protein